MEHKITVTRISHDASKTVGYAEGTLDHQEFTATWATFRPLVVVNYDSSHEMTSEQNDAISKALNDMNVIPEVIFHESKANV